jgi:thiosulfate/3-mercaptopyruvate sulfurtransferase
VSVDELRALRKSAGLAEEGEEISFCNTGHWASLGWFVDSEILGNKQAKLYDGSMVEWTADDSLPVETKAGAQ